MERLALTDKWVRDLLLKSGAIKEMAMFLPDLFFIDGTEVTLGCGRSTHPRFSPDSKRLALIYTSMSGRERLGLASDRVYVDGTLGKAYNDVLRESLCFSPDSRRLAYGVRRGKKHLVVVDGLEGKPYAGNPSYFPYRAGQESQPTVFSPVFGPDSRHVAYIADRGTASTPDVVVVDGVEGTSGYEENYNSVGGVPLVFRDARSFDFIAKRGDDLLRVEVEIAEE